eukprot:Platyproteum_vivax@DN2009_c0_g1_i1.p1
MAHRFIPLLDRILVKKFEEKTISKGGIHLMNMAKATMNQATVIAVGPGKTLKTGEVVPCCVKAGQIVVIPEYGGMPLKLEDEEFMIFRDEEMIGVVKDE